MENIYFWGMVKKQKEKDPDRPLLFQMAEGLRPRLEAVKAHKTLTGLLNDVLTAWVEKEERKQAKP